jgi:hypothetical protein
MNIKNYKLFLEKDINWREDEYSHLNDKLNDRWDDSTYDPYDDEYDDGHDDMEVENDDMEHLLYLLRTMFKNAGIEANISNKKMNIIVYILLTPKERLRDVIKIFEVVNKLKRDILIQYSCEFEMWENRQGRPYFEFNFYYEDSNEDVF